MNSRLIFLSSALSNGIIDADADPIFIEDEDCEAGDVARRVVVSPLNNPKYSAVFATVNCYAHFAGINEADDFEAGRTALLNALASLNADGVEGIGAADGKGVYVREISADLQRAIKTHKPFLIDSFAKHLFDATEMSTKERLICEEFNGAVFAALASLADREKLADCMDRDERSRLISELKAAKGVEAKRLLGKRDGRSSDEAFLRRVNDQLRKYAGERPSTDVKLDLVALIHEAQERGGLLYLGGEACRVTCRKRADATTFSFSFRSIETGKQIKGGATVPEDLEILPEKTEKPLDRTRGHGYDKPVPNR